MIQQGAVNRSNGSELLFMVQATAIQSSKNNFEFEQRIDSEKKSMGDVNGIYF